MKKNNKWRLVVFWIILVLAADLTTKVLALQYLDIFRPVLVIDGFFNLILTYNTGVAFGIFSSYSGPYKGLIMAGLAGVALLPFIYFYCLAKPSDRLVLSALGLIWGGALGNIHDRLRWPGVVDFLDFYYKDYHWPAFNVADIAICVGAGLLALSILLEKPAEKSPCSTEE